MNSEIDKLLARHNGLVGLVITNHDASNEFYMELMKRFSLNPIIFIYNSKINMVKYLIENGKIDPNNYVHDLCLWGNVEHIDMIRLLYNDDRFDKRSRDSQDRSVEDCINQNRFLRYRDIFK